MAIPSCTRALVLGALSFGQDVVDAFQTRTLSVGWMPKTNAVGRSRYQQGLQVQTDREADFAERLVGGELYSMVPLPDSMMSTTLFVGNLCEFVKDDDLSDFFKTVSTLLSVPACVVRKPDYSSLRYGVVVFPSVEEKEQAIIRFHGVEWRGKRIKVEPIDDHKSKGRVRVPEKIVEYVSGAAKRTPDGRINVLRRISINEEAITSSTSQRRPSKKRKGISKNSVSSHRLSDSDQAELSRAARKGFLVQSQRAHRGTTASLTSIHRQWCDARAKPQIIVFKAVGGRPVDQLLVDLSPLRLNGLFDDPNLVEDFLVKWKADILTAANAAGLELRGEIEEEEDGGGDDDDDDQCATFDNDEEELCSTYVTTFDTQDRQIDWATAPIMKLPVVRMGVFEGERSRAKAMAKALALLWDIPEEINMGEAESPKDRRKEGARKGREPKMVEGLSENRRRRGGGHRQAW